MDPDVTLAIMRDRDTDTDTRRQAAKDLFGWLAIGGYVPAGEDRVTLRAECVTIATSVRL